jgi:hypothetical protein
MSPEEAHEILVKVDYFDGEEFELIGRPFRTLEELKKIYRTAIDVKALEDANKAERSGRGWKVDAEHVGRLERSDKKLAAIFRVWEMRNMISRQVNDLFDGQEE